MKFFIFGAASIALFATAAAHAASCSGYKSICVTRAKDPATCDGAWKQCMRTGIYIGPESGTNHGQADKR